MKTLIVPVMAALIGLPAVAFGAGETNVASARTAVAEMDQAEAVVGALLQTAQANNDAIKVSCIGDKATQIRGYAAGARKALTRANFVTGTEADATYQGIVADSVTVRQLRDEATACVGAEELAAAEEQARKSDQKVDGLDLGKATDALRSTAGVPVRTPAAPPPAASPAN